jgi:hypothetical protein
MKTVIECLLTLRAQFMPNILGDNSPATSPKSKPGSPLGISSLRGQFSPLSGEERRKVVGDSKFQRTLRSPVMSGKVLSLPPPPTPLLCVCVCDCVYICFKISQLTL